MCVSSGELLPGCRIRVVDQNFKDLDDGQVGDILIKSESLFDGYRNYPEKTAAAFKNGWYLSGDYGFRYGGELYILGRRKDVIIVAGNNIYPEDVEAVVNGVGGVIPGRAVAFGEDDVESGTERLSIVAETFVSDKLQQQQIRLAIIRAGMTIDVSIANVYLVSPRFLVKSSAGKLSRTANKARVQRLKGLRTAQPMGAHDFARAKSCDSGRT
jgi:acyl-CoA synthetase (AMP-forming)/AMP-acid ligase II